MGIRTGRQYLDKLNGMTPEIYVNGEKITSNVADHPLFRNNARTYAHLFDMQHDPVHQAALSYPSPSTGDLVSASFLIPRSEADLIRRRKAFSAWTDFSHGFLGRSGDYMNSSLTALASAAKFFEKVDPVYGMRIRAYYEHARENDLLATHTLVPPQVNRSVAASQQAAGQLTARIIEERADGVVIRGARLLATLGPIADELLVFPSSVLRGTPEDAPYSFAFAIPNDSPGLKYYCRAPLHHGGSAFDEPLASRFEEMDAVVIFDDVLVPHDRVFMLGHPELCNAWYTETGAGALMTHQVVTRTLAKTEFYLGLASEIADTIGIGQFQHIQEDLGELISLRRDREGAAARGRGRRHPQRRRGLPAQVGHAQRGPQLVPPQGQPAAAGNHPQVLRLRPHGPAQRGRLRPRPPRRQHRPRHLPAGRDRDRGAARPPVQARDGRGRLRLRRTGVPV